MEKMGKKEFMEMLREEGKKAGIEPVKNLFNEDQRLAEVKRLGILDLDLSSERPVSYTHLTLPTSDLV